MNFLRELFGATEEISMFIFTLRTVFVGLMLFVEGKILPRRAGGQFAGYDFAFFWMMGGLTAAPLFEARISIINTIVVVVIIYILHYIISYIATKNRCFARIVIGKEVKLIENGQILYKNLKKTFIPLEILLAEIRTMDAFNLNEIETAVLETNGHVSVLKKFEHQPITPKDLKMKISGGGLSTIFIYEGNVIEENLIQLGYSKLWLENELQKKGITNVQDVYVVSLDSGGELYYSLFN